MIVSIIGPKMTPRGNIMSTQAAAKSPQQGPEKEIIQGLVAKARAAMAQFANADQARVDEAVTALAW